HLDLAPRDERTGHRRPKQVLAIVDGARPKRREDEVANEFLSQIFDIAFEGAGRDCFGANAGQLTLALTDIGGDANDLSIVMLAQPWYDDGRVEAAGIGEHDSARHVSSVEAKLCNRPA